MKFTYNLIFLKFPTATLSQINLAIKYQDKFKLTLEDLKCLNPDCNNMRSWSKSETKFKLCCSNECIKQSKSQRTEIIKKIKVKNCLLKYGVNNSNHRLEVKQKKQQTYFERTGYNNPSQNPEVKLKKRKKYLTKTKNDWSVIIQKRRKTNLIKYGTEHPLQNQDVIQKRITKNLTKYGVNHYDQQHCLNFKNLYNREFWIDNFIDDQNHFDYIKAMEYFGYKEVRVRQILKLLGIEYTKLGGTSLKEQALYPLLNDLDIRYESNNRSILNGIELDIYLPELNLAIEYNGSYWHSYHETICTSPKQLDYNYMKYRHQKKSLACYNAGIRLLHLYEHESEDQVLNKLESFLLYEPTEDDTEYIKDTYDLDSGCYILGLDYQALEPEPKVVLNNRQLFNSGKIGKIGKIEKIKKIKGLRNDNQY